MLAKDGGVPALDATKVLTVTVTQNLQQPVFNTPQATVDISEIQSLGIDINSPLKLTDPEGNVCMHGDTI